MPSAPVTLTIEQIDQLNRQLSNMRHAVNNQLALIVAAAELIRFNPANLPKMSGTLVDQPPKITDEINKFSAEFERTLGISRP